MRLLRSKILTTVRKNSGKLFSCSFLKKDGSIRTMLCRTGVKKYLRGGTLGYDPIEKGLIPVYEVKPGDPNWEKEESYRMVNIDTMLSLTIDGIKYQIEDDDVLEWNESEIEYGELTTTNRKVA